MEKRICLFLEKKFELSMEKTPNEKNIDVECGHCSKRFYDKNYKTRQLNHYLQIAHFYFKNNNQDGTEFTKTCAIKTKMIKKLQIQR